MAKTAKKQQKAPSDRFDLYQQITDQVCNALQEIIDGKRVSPPWVRPWTTGNGGSLGTGASGLPRNFSRNKVYRGVNVWLLWMAAAARGFQFDLWASFKEIAAMGGRVKKGEKGTMVVFWSMLYKDAETGNPLPELVARSRMKERPGSVKVLPLLKYHWVFNLLQTEDVPWTVLDKYRAQKPQEKPEEPAVDANVAFLLERGAAAGIRTEFGGDRACYFPMRDIVQCPPLVAFRSIEDGFATLAHELGHATGHPTRLNRDQHGRFGSEEYAKEELVAEVCSGYLCGLRGVTGKLQHVEYIHNWLQRLKSDPREVIRAAKAAQEACEYILGERPAKPEEEVEQSQPEPESIPAPIAAAA